MPLKMEITSIEDVDIDSTRGKESIEVKKGDSSGSDGNEMIEGEFYDTLDKFPFDEASLKRKSSWKQQKMMKQMKKVVLKLRNGGQIEVEVNLTT